MADACMQCAPMETGLDSAAVGRLTAYIEKIGKIFHAESSANRSPPTFFGILSDGERKSVEPIAARATGDPEETQRSHDRLLHFLGQSPWSDEAVRREAALHAVAAMTEQAPVTT